MVHIVILCLKRKRMEREGEGRGGERGGKKGRGRGEGRGEGRERRKIHILSTISFGT